MKKNEHRECRDCKHCKGNHKEGWYCRKDFVEVEPESTACEEFEEGE